MMAMDIDSFTPIETFKKRVDAQIRQMKSSPKAPGFKEILVAGELEFREKEKALKEGVQVEDKTWENLEQLMRELGLSLPSAPK